MSSARKQKQGSAQGASESTYIFAAELEPLIRLLEHMAAENGKNSEIGYACGETILSILAYADDMVMLASSEEGLAEMVRALERFSRWTGLEISINSDKKNKTALFATDGKELNIMYKGKRLPQLGDGDSYKYLGVSQRFPLLYPLHGHPVYGH